MRQRSSTVAGERKKVRPMADEFFVIKKNVPPPAKRASKLAPIYPFNSMVVGDCFDVPVKDDEKASRVQARVLAGFHTYRKRHPEKWDKLKLTTLYIADESIVRVWLVDRED